jgi:hypothetical protein
MLVFGHACWLQASLGGVAGFRRLSFQSQYL